MRTIKTMAVALAASLMLVACGENPNGTNPTGTNPTDPIEQSGTLTAEATYLGQDITCFTYDGDEQIGMSWDPIEMEPGTVNVNVGDARINDNLTDAPDDLPLLHEMPDGSYIGFAAQDATVNANEDTTVNFEGGKVFWGEYVCTDVYCSIDDDSNCNEVADSAKTFYVNSDLDVAMPDGSAPLSGLNLSVNGDQFSIDREEMTNVSSSISEDSFEVNYSDPFASHTVTCIKQ